jgi:hypothetical protein
LTVEPAPVRIEPAVVCVEPAPVRVEPAVVCVEPAPVRVERVAVLALWFIAPAARHRQPVTLSDVRRRVVTFSA